MLTDELGMSTPELRAMALLLGSDYTVGIKNVGIVNATEIVRAFPLAPDETSPVSALRRFRT
jgi:DNA excision repair protein ERCC-5